MARVAGNARVTLLTVFDSTSAVVFIGFTLEDENVVFTTDPVNP